MQSKNRPSFSIGKPKRLSSMVAKEQEFYLKEWLPIPKSALTMISAAGGTGKSFLSIQIAIKAILEKEDRKILLWLSEDSEHNIKTRADSIMSKILKLSKETQKQIADKIDIYDMSEMPFHLNYDNIEDIKKALKLEPYNLVILDPLIAFYDGDENNNSQAHRFMNMLNKIAIDNRQSIVLIHHHTKAKKDDPGRTRGASAFIDALRLLYELSYIDDDTPQNRKITVVKDNWGVKPFFGTERDLYIIPIDKISKKYSKKKAVEEIEIEIVLDNVKSKKEIDIKNDLIQKGYNIE